MGNKENPSQHVESSGDKGPVQPEKVRELNVGKDRVRERAIRAREANEEGKDVIYSFDGHDLGKWELSNDEEKKVPEMEDSFVGDFVGGVDATPFNPDKIDASMLAKMSNKANKFAKLYADGRIKAKDFDTLSSAASGDLLAIIDKIAQVGLKAKQGRFKMDEFRGQMDVYDRELVYGAKGAFNILLALHRADPTNKGEKIAGAPYVLCLGKKSLQQAKRFSEIRRKRVVDTSKQDAQTAEEKKRQDQREIDVDKEIAQLQKEEDLDKEKVKVSDQLENSLDALGNEYSAKYGYEVKFVKVVEKDAKGKVKQGGDVVFTAKVKSASGMERVFTARIMIRGDALKFSLDDKAHRGEIYYDKAEEALRELKAKMDLKLKGLKDFDTEWLKNRKESSNESMMKNFDAFVEENRGDFRQQRIEIYKEPRTVYKIGGQDLKVTYDYKITVEGRDLYAVTEVETGKMRLWTRIVNKKGTMLESRSIPLDFKKPNKFVTDLKAAEKEFKGMEEPQAPLSPLERNVPESAKAKPGQADKIMAEAERKMTEVKVEEINRKFIQGLARKLPGMYTFYPQLTWASGEEEGMYTLAVNDPKKGTIANISVKGNRAVCSVESEAGVALFHGENRYVESEDRFRQLLDKFLGKTQIVPLSRPAPAVELSKDVTPLQAPTKPQNRVELKPPEQKESDLVKGFSTEKPKDITTAVKQLKEVSDKFKNWNYGASAVMEIGGKNVFYCQADNGKRYTVSVSVSESKEIQFFIETKNLELMSTNQKELAQRLEKLFVEGKKK